MLFIIVLTIIIALIYDFLNGMNDAANSIATIVSTRIMSPTGAVIWAAFFNFAAYFLFGTHVANTIGKGIVEVEFINEYFVLSALVGAGIWVYFCTYFGLPISVSHALIGGMIGPGLIAGGVKALVFSGIFKVVLFIVLSPIIGFLLGYIIMVLTMWVFRRTSPFKVDSLFRVLQLASSAAFSIGHGSNDAQKTMGIITILLFQAGYLTGEFHVPEWVVITCYTAMAAGTLAGGWKVIKTLGVGLTTLKPVGGFSAETAGAITLMFTSALGIPVSTTHTITGSVIGVGITRRVSAVKWAVAYNIIAAWVLTIPLSAIISALVYLLIG